MQKFLSFFSSKPALTFDRLNASVHDLTIESPFVTHYGIKIAQLNPKNELLDEKGKVITCNEEELINYVKDFQQKVELCELIAEQPSFNANLNSADSPKYFKDKNAVPGDFVCRPSSELHKITITYLSDNWELIHLSYDLAYQSKQLKLEHIPFDIPNLLTAPFLKNPLPEKKPTEDKKVDYTMQKIKMFLADLIYAPKNSEGKIFIDIDTDSKNINVGHLSILTQEIYRIQRNFNAKNGLSFTILKGEYDQVSGFQGSPIYNTFHIDKNWTNINFGPNSTETKESLLTFLNSTCTKQGKNLGKDEEEEEETEFDLHCS